MSRGMALLSYLEQDLLLDKTSGFICVSPFSMWFLLNYCILNQIVPCLAFYFYLHHLKPLTWWYTVGYNFHHTRMFTNLSVVPVPKIRPSGWNWAQVNPETMKAKSLLSLALSPYAFFPAQTSIYIKKRLKHYNQATNLFGITT